MEEKSESEASSSEPVSRVTLNDVEEKLRQRRQTALLSSNFAPSSPRSHSVNEIVLDSGASVVSVVERGCYSENHISQIVSEEEEDESSEEEEEENDGDDESEEEDDENKLGEDDEDDSDWEDEDSDDKSENDSNPDDSYGE